MSFNQYSAYEPTQGPNKWVIGGVACATTVVVAAATFALTGNTNTSAYYAAPAAVKANTQVMASMPTMARGTAEQPQAAFAQPASSQAEFVSEQQYALNTLSVPMTPASASNSGLLLASFSAMLLAVASALGAAFGYRSEALAMASGAGGRSAKKGSKAQGGQAGVGYKGSTIAGSAPPTRSGKPGFVYKLGTKNGLGNVDEYSPIYNPVEWKSDGDVYEPGLVGIALWAVGFLTLLGVSGFLIYYTSAV